MAFKRSGIGFSLTLFLGILCAGCTFGQTSPRELSLVGVMVENHQGARPHHRGLDRALFIQEFLVEGGITRFLLLFDAKNVPEEVGPVRSLRPYFIDAAMPWASVLLFAGGSPEALDRARTTENLTAKNLLGHGHYVRDSAIAAPHNLYLERDGFDALMTGATLHTVTWPPYPVKKLQEGTDARFVQLNFFSRTHNVSYSYDDNTESYERQNGTVISAAMPSNIVVLQAPITGIGEHGRLTIPLEEGKLLLFRSGTVQEGRWSKAKNEAWAFTDLEGNPLTFNPGLTWLTVLPDISRATWSAQETTLQNPSSDLRSPSADSAETEE